MRNKYRVLYQSFGYSDYFEAQIKFWWFPFLFFSIGRAGGLGHNTSLSLEDAKELIKFHKNKSYIVYEE